MAEISSEIPSGMAKERASVSERVTGASRYLAAAAYHDRAFRRSVLEFAQHAWYRAPAPEFGINEAFVTEHCRAAERREHLRNALMLLAFLVVAHEPMGWFLSNPELAIRIIDSYGWNLILGVFAAATVLFVERLITEHFTPSKKFSRDAADGDIGSPQRNKDEEFQNLVVYGAYSPFVGSGYNIGGWSFSVNLERTRDENGGASGAMSFVSWDMLNFVSSRLDRLRISELRHYPVLFADGRLVKKNGRKLLDNGVLKRKIDPKLIAELDDSQMDGARSYLCINIIDWNGEIVLSVYLRCKKGETNLFVEASYFILAPPKRSFFQIDEIDPKLRLNAISRTLVRSMLLSPFTLVAGVLRLISWMLTPVTHWLERRRIRKAINRNPQFNFGSTTSIRELGMENSYRVYFQQLDKERHMKTVEQCTIDAMVEFLDAHNINTSDIRDRRSTILNNGVMMSGGSLTAENMSVGDNARAMITRFGAKVGIGNSGTSSTQTQPVRTAG